MNSLRDKTALVTGGGGFIGSTLVERIADEGVEEVRVFDNDEQSLFRLKRRLDGNGHPLNFVLGDLRDENRVRTVMEDVDVVFHAGAIKHVGLSEYNPFEAAQTNVTGTKHVVRAAFDEEIDSLVAVSTDKASNPTSVMGATKLIMERIVVAANTYNHDTSFNCVRFGNVLGSTGSVVPVFLDQIRNGGPLTVTNPEMTRFTMSPDRAADLILEANESMTQGEIVIPKMPAFRVGDLAEGLRAEYAPTHGYDGEDIGVEIVGGRPGERVHEKLVSSDEIENTYEVDDKFVLLPHVDFGEEFPYEMESSLDHEYTSVDSKLLSPSEIAERVKSQFPPRSSPVRGTTRQKPTSKL